MADIRTFLSLDGLKSYDGKLKTWVQEQDLASIAEAVKQAKNHADGKDAAIAAAKNAADAAQADVDALEEYVGTIPAGAGVADVIGYVDKKTSGIASDAALSTLTDRVDAAEGEIDAIQADYLKKADKEALQTQITSNKNALDTLNGTGVGSVKKQIDDAFNDFSTKVSDDGVVNSYKELIDWAAKHGGEAAEMAAGIEENKTAIDGVKKLVGSLPEGVSAQTVVALVQELVSAEETRATGAENALGGRVGTLETDIAKKATKEELATLEATVNTKASQADLDKLAGRVTTAEGNITNHGTEISAVKERVDAVEAFNSEWKEITTEQINAMFA